jgi:hypothetical protein
MELNRLIDFLFTETVYAIYFTTFASSTNH